MSQLAITVGSKTLCATLQEVLDHNHHNINCVNLKNLPPRPEVFAMGDTVDGEARMGAGHRVLLRVHLLHPQTHGARWTRSKSSTARWSR
jgi:hypothetical protein